VTSYSPMNEETFGSERGHEGPPCSAVRDRLTSAISEGGVEKKKESLIVRSAKLATRKEESGVRGQLKRLKAEFTHTLSKGEYPKGAEFEIRASSD